MFRAAAEQAARAVLGFHHGADGFFHARVVRRAIRLEQDLTAPLQAQSKGNTWVATEYPHQPSDETIGGEIPARGHLGHAKTEGLKPGEFVLGKVGKAAEADGLRHQSQILQHHALLDGDQLRDHQLQALHRKHADAGRIVMQMPAFAARETAQAGGAKTGALVDDKCAAVLVEHLEQSIDVHERQLIDRQKIGRSGSVERPAVYVDIEHGRQRRRRAPILELYSHAPVQLGELPLLRLIEQYPNFLRCKILRALDQVGGIVVGHNQ